MVSSPAKAGDPVFQSSCGETVKPANFTLTNIVGTSPTTPNPGATSATGAKFIAAGSNFSATVTAVNSLGAPTPNYGKEIAPETVKLTPTLVTGLGLTNNPALADQYGIVMGSSHQEPMLRAQKEWDRRYQTTLGSWNYAKEPDVMENFWREGVRRNKNFESIITIAI